MAKLKRSNLFATGLFSNDIAFDPPGQFYRILLVVDFDAALICDFDGDTTCATADINLMYA